MAEHLTIARIGGEVSRTIDQIAAALHGGTSVGQYRVDAARIAATIAQVNPKKINKDDEAVPILQSVLFFCLNGRHFHDAAKLIWSPNLFSCEPEATRQVWTALDNSSGIIIMGGASMSKTYGCGGYYMLEWLADPEYTTVKVLGPSEDHLQDNLFSHLVELHRSSAIPLPGKIGDLFIGLDLRQRRSSISGVIVPVGKRPAGRLQGTKRFPRRHPHPIHGSLSRLRILLDEAENIPQGIWSDIDNVLANSEGQSGLKIACAYNPKDSSLPLGVRAEPPAGWRTFNLEKDYEWVSNRGWRVIRLDGERSENVVQNRIIFPGLQTREGLNRLAQSSGGRSSASYFTFGRGAYPQEGSAFTIIPQSVINKLVAEVVWLEGQSRASGFDLALEGGAKSIHGGGLWGLATGLKYPKSIEFPNGLEINFTDAKGRPASRNVLQLIELKVLDRGDSVKMARTMKLSGQTFGTKPGWVCCDRTGHGQGVYDIAKEIWSPELIGINFSEASTHTKILAEDDQFCDQLYDRIVTEVWFALARWAEFDIVKIHPDLDAAVLLAQVGARQFKPGLKNRVESKREYRDRTNQESPDEADAFTLLVHAVRKNIKELPSALPNTAGIALNRGRIFRRGGASERPDHLD